MDNGLVLIVDTEKEAFEIVLILVVMEDGLVHVNALTKKVVKDLLVMINLPYSRELAGFIRYIVEYPNTIRYSEYKRSLIGKTVEDVIFEQ